VCQLSGVDARDLSFSVENVNTEMKFSYIWLEIPLFENDPARMEKENFTTKAPRHQGKT